MMGTFTSLTRSDANAGNGQVTSRRPARRYLLLLLGALTLCLLAAPQRGSAAPEDNEGWEPFSFVVIADPQPRRENQKPMDLKPVAESIEGLHERPDHIIIVGDMKKGSRQFLSPLIETDIPVHVVMGNWENQQEREELRSLFSEDFGNRDFYSFRHNDCLFVGMCNTIPGDHVGHLQSEFIAGSQDGQQYHWLQEKLGQPDRFTHTFVFGHIPPRRDGGTGGAYLNLQDALFLRGLVTEREPTALFFGHLHRRMHYSIGETPVYVMNAVSWNSDGRPPQFLQVKVQKGDVEVNEVQVFESPEDVLAGTSG